MAKDDKKVLDKVTTPKFRVSWPAVLEPEAFEEGGKKKYSLIAIFDPKKFDAEDKKKWREMHRIFEESWKAKFKGKKPANLKSPFRDGMEKEDWDGFGEGKIFCTLSTLQKPGLIDRHKDPITEQEDFYAGCYARATVTCYAFENKGNRGVGFGLHNVQKLADGPAFSQRTDAEEDFDDYEGPDEEEGGEDDGSDDDTSSRRSSGSKAGKSGKGKKSSDDDDDDFLS